MVNVNGNGNSPMSSDFAWDLNRPERTQELFERFDVQKAKSIIVEAPRPIEFIDMRRHGAVITDFLDGVKLKDEMDWEQVDVTLPVIFARTPEGKIPIDGRHRLKKALDEGVESVPVVFLTEEETEAIRIKLV